MRDWWEDDDDSLPCPGCGSYRFDCECVARASVDWGDVEEQEGERVIQGGFSE